jgi:hypothetical protein
MRSRLRFEGYLARLHHVKRENQKENMSQLDDQQSEDCQREIEIHVAISNGTTEHVSHEHRNYQQRNQIRVAVTGSKDRTYHMTNKARPPARDKDTNRC